MYGTTHDWELPALITNFKQFRFYLEKSKFDILVMDTFSSSFWQKKNLAVEKENVLRRLRTVKYSRLRWNCQRWICLEKDFESFKCRRRVGEWYWSSIYRHAEKYMLLSGKQISQTNYNRHQRMKAENGKTNSWLKLYTWTQEAQQKLWSDGKFVLRDYGCHPDQPSLLLSKLLEILNFQRRCHV